MIPLRDNIPSRRFPVMNAILIAFTVLAFFYELKVGQDGLERLFLDYGVVPSRTIEALARLDLGGLLPLFTAIFLHGGWMHIIGNMLFLWVFGDNVEDLMGPWRYLVLYLSAGAVANLAHVWAVPGSDVPTIGASGAVAAILGAYLVNFPYARVSTLMVLGFFITRVDVPAAFFLLVWFALQLINGVATLGVPTMTGVAWWAHVGGFVAGAVLVRFFRERRPVR